jgi:hypothetical protein
MDNRFSVPLLSQRDIDAFDANDVLAQFLTRDNAPTTGQVFDALQNQKIAAFGHQSATVADKTRWHLVLEVWFKTEDRPDPERLYFTGDRKTLPLGTVELIRGMLHSSHPVSSVDNSRGDAPGS